MHLHKNIWHVKIPEEFNVHGITKELPNMFNQFIARFIDCFIRSDLVLIAIAYVRGLLSDIPRKTAEAIAIELIDNPKGAIIYNST